MTIEFSDKAEGSSFIYVSCEGSNDFPGSESKPLRTVQAAAEKAAPGDTVRIFPGVYREWVNPLAGGSSDEQRISFEAWGEGDVVLTGAEPLLGWSPVEGDVWMVEVDNEVFAGDNPYAEPLKGHWLIKKGRDVHRGQLYRNGHWLREATAREDVTPHAEFEALWFAAVGEATTRIWAQFPDGDPNKENIEFNVRKSVFYPTAPGVSWLTLRGLTFRCAATPWSPPTTEQIGIVGTNWGLGWVIEDCEVAYCPCAGITLGKFFDPEDRGDEPVVEGTAGADTYHHTIERALKNGWEIGKTGDHVVRNCRVHHCEQAGICGSLGPVRCRIEGNEIYQIHLRRQFGGCEQAGIKFHAAVDTVIEANCIHHCVRGIWLDWMTQGTRVTRNVFHSNGDKHDLFVEVNHGPFVVDHNFFLSSKSLMDWSHGGAYVHNFFAGLIQAQPEKGRQTPWLESHGTKTAGLSAIEKGDNRFVNNLFLDPAGLGVYEDAELPMQISGNAYIGDGPRHSQEADAPCINGEKCFIQQIDVEKQVCILCSLSRDDLQGFEIKSCTADQLGCAQLPSLPFETAQGEPVDFSSTYLGRDWGTDCLPGPCPEIWHSEKILRIW